MRLDQLLVNKSFARSRTQANDLIKAGKVKVFLEGEFRVILKPSYKCGSDLEIKVMTDDEFSWVSRSGEKLNLALKKINLDLNGLSVFDVGQSTGGFTECALRHGAKSVFGVDVGKGQLAIKLKEDKRVKFLENIDARELLRKVEDRDLALKVNDFDCLVMDLSFISVTKVIKSVLPFIKAKSFGLILIKPQFEVGKDRVQRGGIVMGSSTFLDCQRGIFDCINDIKELTVLDYFPSGLRGKDGNQEFFCFFKKL